MNQNSAEVIRSIPLSNDTVARRIDESTLCDNEAPLLLYVRFTRDAAASEELLFAKSLVTDTKGESIFEVTQSYFEHHNIPLSNIIACSTDGLLQ